MISYQQIKCQFELVVFGQYKIININLLNYASSRVMSLDLVHCSRDRLQHEALSSILYVYFYHSSCANLQKVKRMLPGRLGAIYKVQRFAFIPNYYLINLHKSKNTRISHAYMTLCCDAIISPKKMPRSH